MTSSSTRTSPDTRPGSTARPWIGLVAGLVLLLSAVALFVQGARPASDAGAVPLLAAPDARESSAATTGAAAPRVVGPPRSVSIAQRDISADVQPVAIRSGALQVPEDGEQVGWWQGGAMPGSAVGTVVVTGHVDTLSDGPGAFYRLETVDPGAVVDVATDAGPVRYRVEARRAYRKSQLPQDLFTTTGRPRLALITCGGSFDEATGTYDYNVVLYAVPV